MDPRGLLDHFGTTWTLFWPLNQVKYFYFSHKIFSRNLYKQKLADWRELARYAGMKLVVAFPEYYSYL